MDKLTKEFKSGEVLKAQDLNSIKDKINGRCTRYRFRSWRFY